MAPQLGVGTSLASSLSRLRVEIGESMASFSMLRVEIGKSMTIWW